MDRDQQKIHELEEKFVKEMNRIPAPIIGLAVSQTEWDSTFLICNRGPMCKFILNVNIQSIRKDL